MVPRRGLELARKRLILNVVSAIDLVYPLKTPLRKGPLRGYFRSLPSGANSRLPTHAECWSTPHQNGGSGRA